MVFDGFFIYHLIHELNQHLENSRLEKIYQTSDFSFVFVLYYRGNRKSLVIDLNPHQFGFHMTKSKPSTHHSSQFLNSLKKNLEGAILENLKQHQTDRVIIFQFKAYDFIEGPIDVKLIFEAMGRHSNLLIVKEGIIIDTYKKMFFEEGRQLLPMAPFEFFPSDKLSFFDLSYENIQSPKDLVNRYLGISPLLAKYLFEHQVNIGDIIVKPTRNLREKKDYVFDIFDDEVQKEYYQTISEMMDDHIETKTISTQAHDIFIDKQLNKFYKKRDQFDDMLMVATKNLEQKNNGDLIYQSGLSMSEHYSSLDTDQGLLPLDSTKTLNENAQLFFKAYHKAKRSIEHIEQQRQQNEDLIRLFIEFKTYLDMSTGENLSDFELELMPYGFKKVHMKPSNKKQSHKPKILRLDDGDLHYYIGKNSLQNAHITHQLAQKDDYWFHVKDAPGGHVVVTTHTLSEHVLRKAAMLAAYFSSMKLSASIPVDYTQVKYIKKISGLPGYHVSYKNHKTIFIDIDEQKINAYLNNV